MMHKYWAVTFPICFDMTPVWRKSDPELIDAVEKSAPQSDTQQSNWNAPSLEQTDGCTWHIPEEQIAIEQIRCSGRSRRTRRALEITRLTYNGRRRGIQIRALDDVECREPYRFCIWGFQAVQRTPN